MFPRACLIATEKIKGTNTPALISHLSSELTWIPDTLISSMVFFSSSPEARPAQLDVWVQSDNIWFSLISLIFSASRLSFLNHPLVVEIKPCLPRSGVNRIWGRNGRSWALEPVETWLNWIWNLTWLGSCDRETCVYRPLSLVLKFLQDSRFLLRLVAYFATIPFWTLKLIREGRCWSILCPWITLTTTYVPISLPFSCQKWQPGFFEREQFAIRIASN